MKVCLFSDTVADVNGVSRFIQNIAEQALASGCDLTVATSTRLECPDAPNIVNFKPALAMKMPRYEQLDLAVPPFRKVLRWAREQKPDVIHVSTPGPVGTAGRLAARRLGVPILGVYHTDFPAYIDYLFDDVVMTRVTERVMRAFYKPFGAVFTRSDDYTASLEAIGIKRANVVRLKPGFRAEQFHTRFRDTSIWPGLGARAETVKVLSVGRVSVEKNLPMLVGLWPRVVERCRAAGVEVELIVVGDGPYRSEMASRLAGRSATFLGFRHGEELSRIYASSDLFVFPSTTDTLGQVVMESQGSGIPVMVSDQGGPKEVVEDGRTGFVLSADDPRLWIERLVELATDEGRRRAIGRAGHELMQGYSMEHSFEHFWQVHAEVLAASGG